MLVVHGILGREEEQRFAGRRREVLLVDSADAAKRRMRATTDCGTDVAIDLERGSYLAHWAVLVDDGERVVVVERTPEQALVVRPSLALAPAELVRQAARIGHAFGNQHVPLEVAEGEIRIPITTSPEIAAGTVRALGLEGVEISVSLARLGKEHPIGSQAADEHG
jgi:urease accessory protein